MSKQLTIFRHINEQKRLLAQETEFQKCRFVNDVLQNQKTWQLEIKDLM